MFKQLSPLEGIYFDNRRHYLFKTAYNKKYYLQSSDLISIHNSMNNSMNNSIHNSIHNSMNNSMNINKKLVITSNFSILIILNH